MCFLKIKFFLFKINFFILLDRFDTLISEIIFLKKQYFNIFLNKNYFNYQIPHKFYY